jgi:hypothetical protein
MTRRTFSRCLALGPALAALALGSTSLLAMYPPGYPWIRLTVPLEPGSLRAAGMPGTRPSLWVSCENGLGREVVFALAEGTAADAGTTCVHRTDGSNVELKPGQKDRCPLQPREAIALSVAGDGADRDYQVLEADGETLVTMVRFSFR